MNKCKILGLLLVAFIGLMCGSMNLFQHPKMKGGLCHA